MIKSKFLPNDRICKVCGTQKLGQNSEMKYLPLAVYY